MASKFNPAAHRRFAVGLFIALQTVSHVAVPGAVILCPVWDLDATVINTTWFFALGVCCGQTSLTALWIGLGPGGILARTPSAILAWVLSVLWITVPIIGTDLYIWIAINAVFAAQLGLCQVPCAIARMIGWRSSMPPNGMSRTVTSGQFTLFQLCCWVAGSACVIGTIRYWLSDIGPRTFWNIVHQPEELIRMAIVAAYPIGICAGLAVPVVWSTTIRRFAWLCMLGLAALLPPLTIAESLLWFWLADITEISVSFPFHQLLLLNVSHCLWLLGNLLVLRLAGYRLERATSPKVI